MKVSRELLERHVEQSNAIENIFVGKRHHLFADHMAAAMFVAESAQNSLLVTMPEQIHSILMKREFPDAGELRKVRVWVGPYPKPCPEYLEKLLKQWKESLKEDMGKESLMPEQKEELAWHYHHWFESIHPFRDGNGRTGRLVLNSIRLVLELPWLIISLDERLQYYNSIREWELKHKELLIS